MEFQVIVNQDNVVEDTEMFSVTFDPAPGETGVGPISDSPIITIQDDTDCEEECGCEAVRVGVGCIEEVYRQVIMSLSLKTPLRC